MRTNQTLPAVSRRWRSAIGIAAAIAAVSAPMGMTLGATAQAATDRAAPRIFTTIEARLPHFAGSATRYAWVAADPLSATRPPPARPRLTGVKRVSGSMLRLQVPVSAETTALAKSNHGVVNLILTVTNGTQMSVLVLPARADGTTTAWPTGSSWRAHGRASVVIVRAMRKPWTLPRKTARAVTAALESRAPAVGCIINHRDYSNNQITRIGELHVANVSTMTGVYYYKTNADSTMTVGISGDGQYFSANGSAGVGNSIGAGGRDPHAGGWVKYVDDTMNYVKQKWIWNTVNGGLCYYLIQAYSSNGDAYAGTLTPGSNPWGNCASAPFRAVVPPRSGGVNGGWDALNSTAKTQNWAFSAFGLFQGSGHTGYITTNRIQYINSGSARTYVCGSGGSAGDVQGSPVIYNNPK